MNLAIWGARPNSKCWQASEDPVFPGNGKRKILPVQLNPFYHSQYKRRGLSRKSTGSNIPFSRSKFALVQITDLCARFQSVFRFNPWRCEHRRRFKISSVGQSAGPVIPTRKSSVRFRQKLKKPRTQIYMDLSCIDPQARVLNYFYK